jgi:PIN domain nuclease of toxin-antitoxin system
MKPGSETLLLDTHVWYWLVNGEEGRVSASGWAAITAAAEQNALGVSEISFWEIALKAHKGGLALEPDVRTWLRDAGRVPGVGIVQLDRDALIHSALIEVDHRDPADRILIATAKLYAMRLATVDDELIAESQKTDSFKVLDLRG